MRRAVIALGLLAAVGAGAPAACTTFAFPRPSESADSGADGSSDATADVTVEAAPEGGTGGSFLSLADAAKFCAQLFRCGRLAEAVELSLAIPVNTPASPLNYSACMDWMAGPVDPGRPGLALQQGILQNVAHAATCGDAEAALPVQVAKADAACSPGCASTTSLSVCSPGGQTFTAACNSAWFAQSGDCFAPDSGLGGNIADGGSAICVSAGACPSGDTCPDSFTLRQCYPSNPPGFTAWNCAVSGRGCVSGTGKVAACAVPGKLAPPCLFKETKDECDGLAVVHCAGGFMAQTELDCSPFDGGCSTMNPPGVARCVSPGAQCTPFDPSQNQCSGTSISVCIGGQPQTINCAGTGIFTTCQPNDATHTAHCG
jgi:hypothetical protein